LNEHSGKPYVFDLHSDLVTDIAIRRARGERRVFARRHFRRLVEGGVRAAVAVLWVEPEYRQHSAQRFLQLFGSLMADLEECRDCVELVTDAKALSAVVNSGKVALFLGLEGMTFVEQWPLIEAIGDKVGDKSTQTEIATSQATDAPPASPNSYQPNASLADSADSQLAEKLRQALAVLVPAGLRHAILVWGERNQIASGPGAMYRPELGRGLTPFGRQVVRELADRNVVIDLSHLDDESIDGVLDAVEGPVMASHSNARALCDVPRNLLDRHIREIGQRGGVIGLNSYPDFIDGHRPTIDRLIDHAVYIADLIGIDHVAFGFDFTDYLTESGYGVREDAELRSVEDVPKLIARMRERGFSEADIEKIAFANALRMMTQ
jgi:membrane dipeptidase